MKMTDHTWSLAEKTSLGNVWHLRRGDKAHCDSRIMLLHCGTAEPGTEINPGYICARCRTSTEADIKLLPCPFCGRALTRGSRKINPNARCTTEGCYGAKMPVVNLDVPESVKAWNTRALTQEMRR